MLGSSDLVAFVATTDLDRARAFYGATLGLPVVEDTPFACVFDAHGTQLRVTPVGEIRTAPYTVLGWAVDDIVATVHGLGASRASPGWIRTPSVCGCRRAGPGWRGSATPMATCCR